MAALLSIFGFLCLYTASAQFLSCTFSGGGATFDLDLLYRTSAQGDYIGADKQYQYRMNVCGAVTYGGNCTQLGGTICQYLNGTYLSVVSTLQPSGVWSLLDETDPYKGVKLTSTNGDLCYANGANRTAIISFHCNPNAAVNSTFSIYENDGDPCTYYLSLDTPNACPEPSQVFKIAPGEVIGPKVLPQTTGSIWDFYTLDVGNAISELYINTTQTNNSAGYLELYVRQEALPTEQTFDRRDTSNGLRHSVSLTTIDAWEDHPLTPGSYYIGVKAINVNLTSTLTYTLQAFNWPCFGNCSGQGVCVNKVCSCNAGWVTDKLDCSASLVDYNGARLTSFIDGGVTQYWRYNLTDQNAYQLFVEMIRDERDPNVALPILMIKLNNFPTTSDNDGITQDWNLPSKTWQLGLSGSVLKPGFWIIGVVGSKDTTFNYSLQVNVFDCDKNCSGHGVCNGTDHSCLCDAGWQGTLDCSVAQNVLTPGVWTPETIGPYDTGFFGIDIPSNVANAPLDVVVVVTGDPTLPLFYPPIYLAWNRLPSSSDYDLASSSPPSRNQSIRISHKFVEVGRWFIGVINNAPSSMNIFVNNYYEGTCPVPDCSGHGVCKMAVCECADGWQGTACDVGSSGSSNDNVDAGTVVALVFVFLFLGVVAGIFIKRQFPAFCAKSESTLADTHRVNYEALT